jgi:hypothetical protein
MNITLSLTVDEVNYILSALGSRPFAEVQNLIFNIKQQGEAQIKPDAPVQAVTDAAATPDAPAS